jgi:GH35 family endo-1,4-beta-xylanase
MAYHGRRFRPLTAAAHQEAALKDLMPRGMVIGVALNQRQFEGTDTAAVDIVTKQFNQISPENVLKFQPIHPAADRYAFEAADRFVQSGADRRMQVVGHTLVWHSQTGAWVFQGAEGKPPDRDTLLARMRDHIRTVVGRYKGRIHGWDVVNEAIDEDGSLRRSPWQVGIGDDYIATGLKVMYTELDINLLPNTPRGADPAIANPYANGLPDEVQQQLARRYGDVFRLFLKHRNAVTRVTFWGLSDADSWLNRGRMNYPLLWDRQRRPKPAFDAVVEVLKNGR